MSDHPYVPNDIWRIILDFLESVNDRKNLVLVSNQLSSFNSDQEGASQMLKKCATERLRLRNNMLTSIHLHYAPLAAWIIDNYRTTIQKHNVTGLKIPPTADLTTTTIGTHDITFHHWDMMCFNQLILFHKTPHFETLARLLPYHTSVKREGCPLAHSALNLHQIPFPLQPRMLNKFELQLFNIYNKNNPGEALLPHEIPRRSAPLIRTEADFLKQLDEQFGYHIWKDWIDWSIFLMVGGSVLKCILANSSEIENQDIDFFFSHKDYSPKWYSFDKGNEKFANHWKEVEKDGWIKLENSEKRRLMYTYSGKINGKQLKFRFTWYDEALAPGKLLNLFDIDACQVGFTGEKVVATPSFVQALTTSTMINYKLVNEAGDKYTFLPRTLKYIHRGFTLLTPKRFNPELLTNENELKEDKNAVRVIYTGLILNTDSLQVCDSFVELIAGIPIDGPEGPVEPEEEVPENLYPL